MKTLTDFYTSIDALIVALRAAGGEAEATHLNSLLHETAWTTASELIGELNLALQHMKGKHAQDVEDDITECITFATHHRTILGIDS